MGQVIKKTQLKFPPIPISQKWTDPAETLWVNHQKNTAFFETSKTKIIQLACQMAERIIETQVTLEPDILNHIYQTALLKLECTGPIQITVHPLDYLQSEFLQKADSPENRRQQTPSASATHAAHMAKKDPPLEKAGTALTIIQDNSLKRGSCIVSGNGKHYNRSITELLNIMSNALEHLPSD